MVGSSSGVVPFSFFGLLYNVALPMGKTLARILNSASTLCIVQRFVSQQSSTLLDSIDKKATDLVPNVGPAEKMGEVSAQARFRSCRNSAAQFSG